MPVSTLLAQARQHLKAVDIPSYALDAELLLAHVLGISREQMICNPRALTDAEHAAFQELLARRKTRVPMAHLLGRREFYGRDFMVTYDVLDPRPDTETLIDEVLKHAPYGSGAPNILDIGTGSGCILLTLLCELPEAQGVAVDISPLALKVAAQNAGTMGLSERVRFLQADMRGKGWQAEFQGCFDVIVSNPPYIASAEIPGLMPEVARYEPKLALDGGKDGLDCYKKLATYAATLLRPSGFVCVEIGDTQAAAVSDIFNNSGFLRIQTIQDLSGRDRCISCMRPL